MNEYNISSAFTLAYSAASPAVKAASAPLPSTPATRNYVQVSSVLGHLPWWVQHQPSILPVQSYAKHSPNTRHGYPEIFNIHVYA